MPYVIGIDPSLTATGLCVLSSDVSDWNISETVGEPTRGANVYARLGRYIRICDRVRDSIGALLGQTSMVVIEGYSFASRNSQAHTAGEFGGLLRYTAILQYGQQLVEVTPSQLKKYATGKGNATKDKVAVGVFKRWGFEGANDNETDAFVLAKIGAALLGWEEPTNEAQRAVLATVRAANEEK
jgi:crossover junction endodeoxyribonuclease RuvC